MGRILFRFVLTIFILAILVSIGFFIFIYFSLYKPQAVENIHIRNPQQNILIPNTLYSITTLNIGYGAHDKSSSYSNSTTQISSNIKSITEQLSKLNSDFFTLQEVDQKGKRSKLMNQNEKLTSYFTDYSSAFAYTYNSAFIPLPINKPIGQLQSGLLTLSSYSTIDERRIALPSSDNFKDNISQPHSAILETLLPVRGNAILVIANLQLDGYITDSVINEQQFQFLEQYISEHISLGRHLILSGDWNHMLTSPSFKHIVHWPSDIQKIPSYFQPKQMNWAIDTRYPTSRAFYEPYQEGQNFVSITDGFLVNDSIEIVDITTASTSFAYSHHQPVTLTFRLKY